MCSMHRLVGSNTKYVQKKSLMALVGKGFSDKKRAGKKKEKMGFLFLLVIFCPFFSLLLHVFHATLVIRLYVRTLEGSQPISTNFHTGQLHRMDLNLECTELLE